MPNDYKWPHSITRRILSEKFNYPTSTLNNIFGAGPQKLKIIKNFRFLWGPAPKVPPENKLTVFYFKDKDLIFRMI